MQNDLPALHDVVIAGGGPVGLFLACELRLAGVSVLVLERAETPDSPLKAPPFGIRGLSAPTIEAFYRRGLLDEIAASGKAVGSAARGQRHRPGGHFAGLQFSEDNVETSRWRYRLPGPTGTTMAVTMEALERILEARASALGVDMRRGIGVDGFDPSSEDVQVHAGAASFRGRWLVGCDGGRSTVRKLGGFDFAGTDPELTGYSVAVELADPESLPAGRHYTPSGMFMFTPPGTIAMVEFDAGAFHRTQPVTREHVQAVLRRVSGRDVGVTHLRYATTWTDRACQATAYLSGRVLLAGDAAHIHSPLGGQGLNLGLGDALNLGWKLAATIRGEAPPDLLGTYWSERAPIGTQVLDRSRAQVALMRPSPSSRALAAIVGDLLETRDGATYFAERIWGVSLSYDLGGAHPLVGRSVPDFELIDGARIGALLREGKGLLLDFDARASLAAFARRWDGRIRYRAVDAVDGLGLRAVLVRPDGYVAWACDGEPDEQEAFEAAARWFGAPGTAEHPSHPAPYGSSSASTT